MSPRILIIGGGIAGLSAAQRLKQNNLTDLTILEAKDRLGGRIHTVEYGDAHLELGAQWIHGEGENPLYLLAKTHGLVHIPSDIEEERDSYFYTQHGHHINQQLVEKTCDILDDILDNANTFSREEKPSNTKDDSVGTYFRTAFEDELLSSRRSEVIKKQMQAIFDWRVLYEKSDNGSRSMDELSLYSWGQYLEYDGNPDVVLSQGYQPILDLLQVGLNDSNVCLNTEVTCVNWQQDKGASNQHKINVTLRSGEKMSADYVIYTCSLGVMKAKARTMFVPSLSQQKLDVIDRIGFSTVVKIYLEFEEQFWDDDCEGIQLAWLSGEQSGANELNVLDKDHIAKFGKWYRGIHSFDIVDFQPHVLCGWVAGNEAEIVESLPEHVVGSTCVELLQKFCGIKVLPKLRKVTRTVWGADPYIRGAYSYIKAGYTAADCELLQSPLPDHTNPRLLFAGEATIKTQFSTAHGAMMSGESAADVIIRHQNI